MTDSGGNCAICGNFYDKAFTVTRHDGASSVFDSVECAAHWLAPRCSTCGITILGHGVESPDGIYCCAHCASQAGNDRLTDRVDARAGAGNSADSGG